MNPKTIELVLRQFAFLFVLWMIGLEALGWIVESIKSDATWHESLNQFGAPAWAVLVVVYFVWKANRIIRLSK